MNYIWRKQAGASWWRGQNEGLTLRFGGTLAVIERPGAKRMTLQVLCASERDARELRQEFGGSIERLRQDWLQRFTKQAQTKPLRIGSRLVISRTPDKGKKPASPRTLVIPAEAAFGTGEHATTAMCLRLLERVTRSLAPGWRMLDAGTGSGILALAGRCFGAEEVLAIDNDPLACATAKRNARANRLPNVEFATGDILKQKPAGKFEIITANLFSEILIAALPVWSRHLAAEGQLIVSGILRSQEKSVLRALKQNRLAMVEIRRRGKWVALLMQPSAQKGG